MPGRLEDGDEGEDPVDQGAGVGDQRLLAVHGQSGDEELGGGNAAPEHGHTRQCDTRHTPESRHSHDTDRQKANDSRTLHQKTATHVSAIPATPLKIDTVTILIDKRPTTPGLAVRTDGHDRKTLG